MGAYKVAEDLDLTGIAFTPIGTDADPFYGTFDGNHRIIKNLNVASSSEGSGLFGVTEAGIIKNIILDNAIVSSSANNTGSIVGIARKNVLVYNCSAENENVTGGAYADEFIG
jgi:hypothetical protein